MTKLLLKELLSICDGLLLLLCGDLLLMFYAHSQMLHV